MFQTFHSRSGKDFVSLKRKCWFFQGAMATLSVTGKFFLFMVLLQEVIPSVQGSSPRGLLLVLVVWTSSCKSSVQKISSGCFFLWICFARQWSIWLCSELVVFCCCLCGQSLLFSVIFSKLEPSHCLLKGCEACLIGHF